jgi:1-acyl-sn-glycerol-3-phosphate acyltransferase
MAPWSDDPAADLARMRIERSPYLPRLPGPIVRAIRLLAAVVLRCWLRVYHRLAITGRGNLPSSGSFILVANHASHLDTLCLLSALPIRQLHSTFPVAAKDYFCKSTLRAFLAAVVVNVLPFERRFVPWYSLNTCADLLEKPGNVLVLFPEGTRSSGLEPGEFKPGVGLLAAGRNVPVVPCHLTGTRVALPKGAWFPRPWAIRLRIGTPRLYAHLPAAKESRVEICRELRDAVRWLGQEAPVTQTGKLETCPTARSHLPYREVP